MEISPGKHKNRMKKANFCERFGLFAKAGKSCCVCGVEDETRIKREARKEWEKRRRREEALITKPTQQSQRQKIPLDTAKEKVLSLPLLPHRRNLLPLRPSNRSRKNARFLFIYRLSSLRYLEKRQSGKFLPIFVLFSFGNFSVR